MTKLSFFKIIILVILLLQNGIVSSASVTYTISAKNTLTTTGTAPSGSNAILVETYSTSKQMTASNSQTLTLSGYNGYKISSITLSMKSNSSSGSGSFSYNIDNGTDISIVSANAFNNASWNGSWSGNYVDITKVVDITCGTTSTVLKISATANSIYCQSYSITYQASTTCTTSNLAFADASINQLISAGVFTKTASSLNNTTAISYTSSNETVATVNATTGEVTPLTAGTTTITATQASGAHNAVDYCAATATYSLNLTTNAPTITVTEVEVPALIAYAGETDSEIIQVSGVNLIENITLAITGTNANLFSVSATSVSQTGGTANQTAVTVNYNPTAPGSHNATLTLSSAGAPSIIRNLNGSSTWKPLLTPVATSATNISTTGFTANWNAVQGATEYELGVFTITNTTAISSDLFISEYIEGSSNNKAIEIYNGTGSSVNLSSYSLKKQTNGSGAYGDALALTGILAAGDVYVIANASANSTIQAVADLQTSSAALSFNGNDAIALFKNSTQIDEVGVFNLTSNWGTDATLIRNSSVNSPKATYDAADWDSNPTDYSTNLGSHTMIGSSISSTPLSGSPFTILNDVSKTLTNLTQGSTYEYIVIAKNANVNSSFSNTISVTTSTGTGISTLKNGLYVYHTDNRLIINSPVENYIGIYNSVGQLLKQIKLNAGKNEIQLNYKGICILKSNNEAIKVVL
jgi:hypothetical protein